MKRLLSLTMLAINLSGCAAPILVRNPSNGQVAQCYSQTSLFLRFYERDKCVESYRKLGWTAVSE
jgi:hypothetical protein